MESDKAEITRLRQVIADFPVGHMSHWDSEGTRGANCPLCIKQREYIQYYGSGKVHSLFCGHAPAEALACRVCYQDALSERHRLRAVLTDLARYDTEPKYLANGHDEVARKARTALTPQESP